jgi:CBS domain-containing protein
MLMPTRADPEGVLPQRAVADGALLQLEDPAVHAITDFTREQPITIDEERDIDAALQDMIRFGVRALLVVRGHRVVGLITSYDIQGERPLQYLQTSNYTRHQDLRVGHIMTPLSELQSVDWASIEKARAGDLLTVIAQTGLTHLIVLEKSQGVLPVVRALVSRARLERQLSNSARPAPRRERAASLLEPGDGRDAGYGHEQGSAQVHADRGEGPERSP